MLKKKSFRQRAERREQNSSIIQRNKSARFKPVQQQIIGQKGHSLFIFQWGSLYRTIHFLSTTHVGNYDRYNMLLKLYCQSPSKPKPKSFGTLKFQITNLVADDLASSFAASPAITQK